MNKKLKELENEKFKKKFEKQNSNLNPIQKSIIKILIDNNVEKEDYSVLIKVLKDIEKEIDFKFD